MRQVDRPYRVVVVDDSRSETELISRIIGSDPELKLIGTASDPFEAVKLLSVEAPDVILLDIEMPRMDGLTFLKKIMSQHPLPVVIFSAIPVKNFNVAVEAFRLGAIDVIQKPKIFNNEAINRLTRQLNEALKGAAISNGDLKLYRSGFKMAPHSRSDHEPVSNVFKDRLPVCNFIDSVIFIGASAGGVQTIDYLVSNLAPPLPPVLISQHMPGDFTRAFSERLNANSALTVKEAEDGETVMNDHVYIANGYKHMAVSKSGSKCLIQLIDLQPNIRYKPSVDILFRSAAEVVGSKGIGIVLTGMGNDGTQGLLEMKQQGAITIAQDEKSSLVWGMPGSAVKAGATTKVYSITEILDFFLVFQAEMKKRKR